MRKALVFCVAVAVALAFTAPVMAKDVPIVKYWETKWWPSKWGAGDEKGAYNLITPKNVMRALKVAKTGKIYRLSYPYSNTMPKFGSRTFSIHIPGLPVGGPLGENQIVWNDEFIVCEVGQVGTQFDGPGHVGLLCKDGIMRWYNGAELNSSENTYGLKTNGVEKLGPCITRGILIDVVGLKGRPLEKGEVIYVKDIEACIKKAGIDGIQEGDAVMFHTGWGRHWEDPATFNAGCPGIGWEAAQYLVKKNVSMLIGDTWPIDVIPGENEKGAFDIHNYTQTVNGIWYLENCQSKVMAQMAKDGTYEFLWIFVPVPFEGATGSPGDGIAIK
jgi:kynurenine formamidase